MRKQAYLLMIVLDNPKNVKGVLKTLEENGVRGATVMDTIGSSSLYGLDDIYVPMIASSMKKVAGEVKYNRTIFSVVKDEQSVIQAMDAVEEKLHMEVRQPGKGIMFTIPLVTQVGVR